MAAAMFTSSLLVDFFLLLGAAFVAMYAYFQHSYQYWKKKGVPYLEPTFPYGNNVYLLPTGTSFAGETKIWYDQLKAKGYKFGGLWSITRKVLVLVDPDYIRDIMTQDFHHFTDRDIYSNESDDPYGTHLFNIKSSGWKPLRQKLTPTFTSGKIKMMFNSVMECSNPMIDYIQKCAENGDDFPSREIMASFTTDIIGSIAFGVDCNSFSNTHAEFRQQGRELFNADWVRLFKWTIAKNFPELARKMRIKTGNDRTEEFFVNMVRQTIEYRTKNNIDRPDFLQLLINMNKESKNGEKPFKFEQIVANTLLFFIAGFDTSSSVLNFSLYELSRNPDIQEKIRQEINKVLQKYNGEITYEALLEMTHLQQVMDESMRLYPPLSCLTRICTKNYQLRDTSIIIEKGTPVIISTLGLGRDPDYFPDPERFDPERFSPEQKAKRHPYIHIPFGAGPRNCIGLRFGIMQSKIGLVRILTNFHLSISSKTKMPLTLNPTFLLLKENETLYLKAKKITNGIDWKS